MGQQGNMSAAHARLVEARTGLRYGLVIYSMPPTVQNCWKNAPCSHASPTNGQMYHSLQAKCLKQAIACWQITNYEVWFGA